MEFVKRYLIRICLICSMCFIISGCKTFQASNASACAIPFDYGDSGANIANKRALLIHYCLCKDESVCK